MKRTLDTGGTRAEAARAMVTMNERGVITLPARLRRTLGLETDDRLIAEIVPGGLLLRPTATLPVEIYSEAREREFDREEAALGRALARPARTSPARKGRAHKLRRHN